MSKKAHVTSYLNGAIMIENVMIQGPGEEFLRVHFPGARQRTWLWHYLKRKYNFAKIGDPDSKVELGAFLSAHPNLIEESRQAALGVFLPDAEFRWVSNSDVEYLFLTKQVRKMCIGEPPWTYPDLTGRRRFIALIDCLTGNLDRKTEIVRQARAAWGNHAKTLRMFNWFKEQEEAAKCEFAWDRFARLKSEVINGRTPFQNKEDVILAFETSSLGASDKELLIQNLKRAWNLDRSRKRSEEQGRSQFNVMLSNESIELLGELRLRLNKSRTQVIEDLIRKECESLGIRIVNGHMYGMF